MDVIIPVFEGCSMFAVSGMISMLLTANHHNTANNYNFKVTPVSTSDHLIINCSHNLKFTCTKRLSQIVNRPDIILVPGPEKDIVKRLPEFKKLADWLEFQYHQGAIIGGSCTGNFILALTGLLKNKTATTHWQAANCFRKLFPDIILKEDKIIIDHGNIVMSGGTLSFQNLMLYLVDKFQGREASIALSKFMVVDIPKDSQSSFAVFKGYKQHKDNQILEIQHIIEADPQKKWDIKQLSELSSLSIRQFNRRFKYATGIGPAEYVRMMKIEFARHYLEQTQLSFSEIAFKSGYEDIQSFRKQFQKHIGISPLKYRKKYTFQL